MVSVIWLDFSPLVAVHRLTLSSLSATLSSPFSRRAWSCFSSSRSFSRRVSAFSTACTAGVSSATTSERNTNQQQSKWAIKHGHRQGNDGRHIVIDHLPCSHSSTSMLGGILRALLAMCFSNVVFPLLMDEMNTRECWISYWMSFSEKTLLFSERQFQTPFGMYYTGWLK